MEKDPIAVAQMAARKADENWSFRTFLKHLPAGRAARLDALAEKFGREAESQMDCRTCGACCRVNHVPLSEAEAERLAGLSGSRLEEFREAQIEPDDDGEPALRCPCVFLHGALCSIYPHRPEACRGYPYVGGELAPRMIGIIERAGTCPIMYEMLERLKDVSGFRRMR